MTIEQQVSALGTFSENTIDMLVGLVLETVNDKIDWNADDPGVTRLDVIDGIKAVIDRKPQDFGTQFEERVQEALSYTPSPFAPY